MSCIMFEASYIQAARNGVLNDRISEAYGRMESCTLCPRNCKINRNKDKLGICKTGKLAMVSSYHPHFGEESPLVGTGGSGTIFFTHCNLLCNFCQNYDISHRGVGEEVSDKQLAAMMVYLQNKGCYNINFVTPSHVIPQILSALSIAIDKGLNIPLVYNTGGYDSVESLKLLENIVDIYMPDLKLLSVQSARKCGIPLDYPDIVKNAILEMHRQVGDLKINNQGIAQRGLLVRHLVLPNNINNGEESMKFLAREVSNNTYVNIMSQYHSCYMALGVSGLDRSITNNEFQETQKAAHRNELNRLDK